jgi:hypothetical protein
MAELNFNALIPEGPRGFYQGFEQGQDQRIARETNQFKLDELKQDREEAMQLQAQLKGMGQDPDLNKYMDTLIATGKPQYVQMGIEGKQKLKDLDAYAKLGGGGATPPAMPMGAPAAPMQSMMRAAPVNAMGSGMFGMEAPTNALAAQAAPMAAPAAPVNALAPQAQQAQARITQLLDFARTNPRMAKQAMEEARLLQDQLELFSKRGQNEPPDAIMMQRLGYPLTQAGYQAYRDAQRQERMLSPAEEQQRIRIAAASRAPTQPVAPTITSIIDPTNPNQMITIDAKRYQGGGAGSAGVIGVSGKEPGAAVRENKAEAGKTQLADDLDNLRASFATLDKMRAIPSTERNPLSNIASATAATGIGQVAGRFVGTEAQVEREIINSARTRLVNSIKNATGMSAQQLNSNVELQTMLKSISDPGQPIQAALRIIDDIDNAYVKGAGMQKKNAPAPAATQGTGGFKYLGKESK